MQLQVLLRKIQSKQSWLEKIKIREEMHKIIVINKNKKNHFIATFFHLLYIPQSRDGCKIVMV